jgi:pimeloyl-ACP methyl ester carboxylesterase
MLKSLVAAAVLLTAAGCTTMEQAASIPAPAGLVQLQGAQPSRFASDRIAVQVIGSGPDVVLVPGLGSSPRAWTGAIAANPGRRYHVVQLNGFAGLPVGGATEGPVAAPAAEELARYIREAGLKKPALIGHSMGGTIGMMVAARHPEMVGRLMVVDMFPFMGAMFGGPTATPESVRPMADQIREGIRNSKGAERDAQLKQTIAGMVRTEALRAEPLADSLASDPDVSARAFHELVVTDLRPELPKIAAPTTVLYVTPTGAPLTDAQMDGFYRASYAALKGAQLKRIPDSAHFIMLDAPERFSQELRAFLAGS